MGETTMQNEIIDLVPIRDYTVTRKTVKPSTKSQTFAARKQRNTQLARLSTTDPRKLLVIAGAALLFDLFTREKHNDNEKEREPETDRDSNAD